MSLFIAVILSTLSNATPVYNSSSYFVPIENIPDRSSSSDYKTHSTPSDIFTPLYKASSVSGYQTTSSPVAYQTTSSPVAYQTTTSMPSIPQYFASQVATPSVTGYQVVSTPNPYEPSNNSSVSYPVNVYQNTNSTNNGSTLPIYPATNQTSYLIGTGSNSSLITYGTVDLGNGTMATYSINNGTSGHVMIVKGNFSTTFPFYGSLNIGNGSIVTVTSTGNSNSSNYEASSNSSSSSSSSYDSQSSSSYNNTNSGSSSGYMNQNGSSSDMTTVTQMFTAKFHIQMTCHMQTGQHTEITVTYTSGSSNYTLHDDGHSVTAIVNGIEYPSYPSGTKYMQNIPHDVAKYMPKITSNGDSVTVKVGKYSLTTESNGDMASVTAKTPQGSNTASYGGEYNSNNSGIGYNTSPQTEAHYPSGSEGSNSYTANNSESSSSGNNQASSGSNSYVASNSESSSSGGSQLPCTEKTTTSQESQESKASTGDKLPEVLGDSSTVASSTSGESASVVNSAYASPTISLSYGTNSPGYGNGTDFTNTTLSDAVGYDASNTETTSFNSGSNNLAPTFIFILSFTPLLFL